MSTTDVLRWVIGRGIRNRRVAADAVMREWAERIGMGEPEYSRCEHGRPDSEADWFRFLTLTDG